MGPFFPFLFIYMLFAVRFSPVFPFFFLCGCEQRLHHSTDIADIKCAGACVCDNVHTVRVRCECVMYDYRSHYDVKSTTVLNAQCQPEWVCAVWHLFFRMCETITNKNTRTLISLSLNVISSRCLLFIFIFVALFAFPVARFLFLFFFVGLRITRRACVCLVCPTTRVSECVRAFYA